MSDEQLMDSVMTYEAETEKFLVQVQNFFLARESDPEQGQFFWAYRIQITNKSEETAQLLYRHWMITDGMGRKEDVKGAGVIGEQPVFPPDESFTYTSGCPLKTPTGFMKGTYEMKWLSGTHAGKMFKIDVPAFSLDSPDANLALN